jgi:deoxycytidine triphosphate deaminase
MEITNNSTRYAIPLVVGRRIAQIAFFQVDWVGGMDYASEGKYQACSNIEEIKKKWLPHAMLPQLWKDREVK